MTTSVLKAQTEVEVGRLHDNTRVILETLQFTVIAGDTGADAFYVNKVKQIKAVAVLSSSSNAASGICGLNINPLTLGGYLGANTSGVATTTGINGNAVTLTYGGVPQISSAAYVQLMVFGH
jgi:hypothetical protein